MDNSGREYRYQKDITVGHTMYHVRCDDWKDFVEAIRNIEVLTEAEPKSEPKNESTGAMVSSSLKEGLVCAECGAPVGPEKQITYKGDPVWVRNCTAIWNHKSGFWRKAS